MTRRKILLIVASLLLAIVAGGVVTHLWISPRISGWEPRPLPQGYFAVMEAPRRLVIDGDDYEMPDSCRKALLELRGTQPLTVYLDGSGGCRFNQPPAGP